MPMGEESEWACLPAGPLERRLIRKGVLKGSREGVRRRTFKGSDNLTWKGHDSGKPLLVTRYDAAPWQLVVLYSCKSVQRFPQATSFSVHHNPLFCPLVQFPHPDVPKTDRLTLVPMCLQLDRRAVEFFVKRLAPVQGFTLQLEMVLHQHAIEKDRDKSGCLKRAIITKDRSGPDHVVGLPLTRLAIWIHERGGFFIKIKYNPTNLFFFFVFVYIIVT